MGTCTFFGLPVNNENPVVDDFAPLPKNEEFDFKREYLYQDELFLASNEHPIGSQYALIQFETPIITPLHSVIIGSKLDTDIRK
jgi:hypothetical protein